MKRFVPLALLLTLLAAAPAFADNGVQSAILSAREQADVDRIEVYLNNLKSISADFMQVDDSGKMSRGTIAIQRPGKMRVNYDAPSKDFIVADGNAVHIWNDDLKSQTNVEQGSSLAEFILRDPIKLKGDVVVTRFEKLPAKLEVTLQQASDPGAGTLTLIFEDKPLLLRQWRVVDAQGRMTGVNLENERAGVAFPASTFQFNAPNFGVSNKAQEQ